MARPPFKPALYEVADVAAIKALANGTATDHQQKVALSWIVWKAAMTYDETMVPGQPDVSDFLQGRRNVGLQIVKLINMPVEDLEKMKAEDNKQ